MKTELNAAVEALKTALHQAIDDPKFNRNHLSELWRHYNGVQTIAEDCPEDKDEIQFPSSPIYLNDNFDYQNIDTNVTGAAGGDVISLDNADSTTFPTTLDFGDSEGTVTFS